MVVVQEPNWPMPAVRSSLVSTLTPVREEAVRRTIVTRRHCRKTTDLRREWMRMYSRPRRGQESTCALVPATEEGTLSAVPEAE